MSWWWNTIPGAFTLLLLVAALVALPAKLALDREYRRHRHALARIHRRADREAAATLQEAAYRARLRGEAWLSLVETRMPPEDAA
jgi:hypothetical protein